MTDINKALDEQLLKLCSCGGQVATKSGHYENGSLNCDYITATSLIASIEAESYKRGGAHEVRMMMKHSNWYPADPHYTKYPFHVIEQHALKERLEALTPTASKTTKLCSCLDTPKGIDVTSCPIHGPKKGKL